MELDEKIKYIREQEELSQERFSNRLGVSRQTVINWEKGKSTPTFELLMLIANEFHIDINSLVQKNMEPCYLPATNKQETETSPVFDPLEKPLYFCKKSFFVYSIQAYIIVSIICLALFGFIIFGVLSLRGDKYLWTRIFLYIPLIGSLFAFLNNFFKAIQSIIENKTKKIYFYKNHYLIQKGLKEKEYFTSVIQYYSSIKIKQSLLGRLLNYGDIIIYFEPNYLRIGACKKPRALKKFIQKTYLSKEDFTIR